MRQFFTFWTPEEDEYLRQHHATKTYEEIGRMLGRKRTAVAGRAQRLKLKQAALVWSPEDDAYLKKNYLRLSARQIGDTLGKTRNSVIGRANRLGLQQSKKPIKQHMPVFPSSEITVSSKEVAVGTYRQSGCQWIDGDPLRGDHTYCGEPLKEGSRFSYCVEHHKIVFRAPIPKKDRQHFRFERGR